MTENSADKLCVACHADERQTPLLRFDYDGKVYWICPRHLPVLIHDPAGLVGVLPGAERLRPADHHD